MAITALENSEELSPATRRELTNLVTRLKAELSGEFTLVPVTAERFFASSGAWTVNPNLSRVSYVRIGRLVTLDFKVATSTVLSTPTYLCITLPAGMTAISEKSNAFSFLNNAVAGTGVVRVNAGGAYLYLTTNLTPTAWTASTLLTSVEGQLVFEVTP